MARGGSRRPDTRGESRCPQLQLTPRNVNTPCDGVDLDATRRYHPTRRTDGHVEFPVGSLSFPVPASLPVTTGASGNGKVKFTFSLNGDTPTTCVYRGNGWNAYNFVKCKQAPLPSADRDDDDGDHDDGPGDPLPVAGTIVTADSFTLHINKGDKTAGTTTVHLHLDGPTEFIPPPQAPIANGQIFTNPNGSHATYSTRDGALLDTDNAFFQPLGTNGRACVSCHQPEDAMGISAVSRPDGASRTPAASSRSSGPSMARTTPPPMFRRWRVGETHTASS